MTTNLARLARAAGAALQIEIGVSATNRAWYIDGDTDTAYWLTEDDLRFALAAASAYPGDAYSHWRAGTHPRAMSAHAYAILIGGGKQ